MDLNKEKLLDDIVKILKNSSAEEVEYHSDMNSSAVDNVYESSLINSLKYNRRTDSYYDCFKDQFIYYIEDDEIYVEAGADTFAVQLRLDFYRDSYIYDSCELPDQDDYYEVRENKGEEYANNWYADNIQDEKFTGDVFEVLKRFDKESGCSRIFSKLIRSDYMEESESDKVTKDFIYSIDDSNKFSITDRDLESFFKSEDGEISIIAADTKIKLITINKVIKDGKEKYKFIVDITNSDSESFCIKAFIETKDQLTNFIQNTVDSLRNYPQFSKYADDLENCL